MLEKVVIGLVTFGSHGDAGFEKSGLEVFIPMYQPCATKIRMKKSTRKVAVPTHRYKTKGVD